MGAQRIVVLGAGWAGYAMARGASANRLNKVCVISPRNHFLFTPLLPSTAVGTLEFRCIQEPIRTLGLDYYQAEATRVNFAEKVVHCTDLFDGRQFQIAFDTLAIAVGMTANTFGIKGLTAANHVFFLRQLSDARAIRNRLLECFEHAACPFLTDQEKMQHLSFVVVGGGPTSIEFSAELHDFLQRDVKKWYPDLLDKVSITLIEASDHILGAFDDALVKYTTRLFEKRKVKLLIKTAVKGIISPGKVELTDGQVLNYGLLVWSTGLTPLDFTRDLDLDKHNGRILVNDNLQVQKGGKTIHDVFAVGDCSVIKSLPLSPLAQVANQQGVYLGSAWMDGKQGPEKPFRYKHMGSMAQVGNWDAIIDASKVGLQGGGEGSQRQVGTFSGFVAFITWRSAYWTKTVSIVNKMLIPMFWFKSMLFGRDISRF